MPHAAAESTIGLQAEVLDALAQQAGLDALERTGMAAEVAAATNERASASLQPEALAARLESLLEAR